MSALAKITNTAPSLPSRVVLYAAEKWGKSSFAAFAPCAGLPLPEVHIKAPKPVFIVAGVSEAKAEAALKAAADKLLANTVIENYRVEMLG